MKIESMSIRGFRCFDAHGQVIAFENLTCFVGPNASGKTAAMIALARLFGETSGHRQIVTSDFHLAPDEELNDKPSRELLIEVRLAFPELEGGAAPGDSVPEVFNQMIVDEPGGTPFCRIRLEATWTNDGTPFGDVEQSISWILTNTEEVEESHRRRVQPGDRAKIRVIYVPATRDPDQQIRATTATTFGRLIDALAWDGTDEAMKTKLAELEKEVATLPGIVTINTQIQTAWKGFYKGRVAKDVLFQALEEDPTALVKLLIPTFRPAETGRAMVASELSDGLRSLFSLSLSLGLFRVEEILRAKKPGTGFKPEVVEKLPVLTLFAVEEPENHLSPQYLGQVVSELSKIAGDQRAQVLISSHSPSILGRVEPDYVRYFLGHEQVEATQVIPIPLPENDTEEEFKYVREAVRGFPELYFARLVIFGEGASEQIILRRLFEANKLPLDTHFISVVPLGGRHVNHFWRLLHALKIPFLTLLDLDREKEGAGWERIQYVRDQIVSRFGTGHEKLRFKNEGGEQKALDLPEYNILGECADTEVKKLAEWEIFFKEKFDVVFSSPLDLDLAMLEAFPTDYKALTPAHGGPRLPAPESATFQTVIIQRMNQVLAADPANPPVNLGSTYTSEQKVLFAWYKYLFLDGSKPVVHMRASLTIADALLREKAPEFLKALVKRARVLVAAEEEAA
jgi:ABC-type cobalamin/Fe3+-siderophores transport system ATPase subunit